MVGNFYGIAVASNSGLDTPPHTNAKAVGKYDSDRLTTGPEGQGSI